MHPRIVWFVVSGVEFENRTVQICVILSWGADGCMQGNQQTPSAPEQIKATLLIFLPFRECHSSFISNSRMQGRCHFSHYICFVICLCINQIHQSVCSQEQAGDFPVQGALIMKRERFCFLLFLNSSVCTSCGSFYSLPGPAVHRGK